MGDSLQMQNRCQERIDSRRAVLVQSDEIRLAKKLPKPWLQIERYASRVTKLGMTKNIQHLIEQRGETLLTAIVIPIQL